MAEMDESDFADMVEQTPVRTYVIEYREPSVDGRPGKLVGACLTDQQSDGLSMIYSFFDVGPDARKGLGTYIILDHIVRAARAGLPYVYLGYWVEGSTRMAYKTSFRPLERLGRDGWRRMDEIARQRRRREPLVASDAPQPQPPADRRLDRFRPPRRRAISIAPTTQPRTVPPSRAARDGPGDRAESSLAKQLTDMVQPEPRVGKLPGKQVEAPEHQPTAERRQQRDPLRHRIQRRPQLPA